MKKNIVKAFFVAIFIASFLLSGCRTADQAIDYSKPEHWLNIPSATDKAVDVFYLYPTSYSKVNKDDPNIGPINDPGMLKGSKLDYARQATAFEPVGNIFAPYYRQVDSTYKSTLPLADQDKIEQTTPKADVFAAFDYFIQHYNNGRPYILVGHSQGANELAYLLSEYMKANPKVYSRMIAAYVIGYSITGTYLAANPHLKFAEGADDTGVIISYNTEAPVIGGVNPVTMPGGIAINPISWTRSEKLATAAENAGSILLNKDGSVEVDNAGNFARVKNVADAQVNLARGVVICSTVDPAKFSPGPAALSGIYHRFDYPFYYFNLRENAANRARIFLAGSASNSSIWLSAENVNLIFVVSPDLAYNAPGDINPATANLTNQGLNRSLLMATYLKQQVLGTKNVTRIYALAPMTHLQTANNYPDMAAIEGIQQFALLNQITLTGVGGYGTPLVTGNSYALSATYALGVVPAGTAAPLALVNCPGCQGLDFADKGNSNEALVNGIIQKNVPGFYVFSAPWETVSALMTNTNTIHSYALRLPAAYGGPNVVYAISITPSGSASLMTYTGDLNPGTSYPALPSPVTGGACTAQKPFTISANAGMAGVNVPKGANVNETVYMIRHAEAHPILGWDDGNFLAAGQWRALALPTFLGGKINPTEVYSIDPAQIYPGSFTTAGNSNFSYVRPALTVAPYAIANNLPFYLVSDIQIFDPNSPKQTSDKFFTGGAFSNKTILLAWEHAHFPPIISALAATYFQVDKLPAVPDWPNEDYDTIWTVTLDGKGNLTVNNALCEGIDSTSLPAMAPKY